MLSELYVNIYTVGAIFTAVVSYFILIYRQVHDYYYDIGEYTRSAKSTLLIVNIALMLIFSLIIGGAWPIVAPTGIIVFIMIQCLKKAEE